MRKCGINKGACPLVINDGVIKEIVVMISESHYCDLIKMS
jgi:hypothetical protein